MKTLKQLGSNYTLPELLPELILPGGNESRAWLESYAVTFYKIQKKKENYRNKVVLADFRLRSNCRHPVYDIYVIVNGSKEPERVRLSDKSMKWLANLYIPETICSVYGKKRLTAELIRQMVLVNPVQANVDLERRVKSKCNNWVAEVAYILSDTAALKDKAMANSLRRKYLAGIMEERRKEQMKQILDECMRQFVAWGTVLYWDDIKKDFEPTEELCQQLFPALPPSVKRFTETMESLQKQGEEHSFFSAEKTLVIQTVPYAENFPYICRIDEFGTCQPFTPKIAKYFLGQIQLARIVNCMPELEGDTERIVGYLLLYLLYPLRMERYNKRQMVKCVADLLNVRRRELAGIDKPVLNTANMEGDETDENLD